MKISIITVCLNPGPKMERTLLSACMQDYDDLEYIVVDGGSTDGTVELLQRYNDRIGKWVSEPDRGIFDAMAKGVSMATGEYIGFLDSGNWYINRSVLRQAVEQLTPETDYLSTAYIHEKQGKWKVALPDPELTHLYLKFDVFLHSALVRTAVFDKYGLLDPEYKCSGDHEYALRLYTQGASIRTTELVTIYYEDGGVSSDPRKVAYREDRLIAIRYGVPRWKADMAFAKRYAGFTALVGLRRLRLDSLARRLLGKSRDIGLAELQRRYCDPIAPWFEAHEEEKA